MYATLALRGGTSTQELVLRNMLHYLMPDAIAVHVSLGSNVQAVHNVNATCGCLLLNPLQHELVAGSARILGVHLANFALLEALISLRASDKVVLLAANGVFVRPCREHILQSALSFVQGSPEPSDGAVTPHGSLAHTPISWPSEWWSTLQREVAAEDDTRSRHGNVKAFELYMLHRRPSTWRAAPLAHMPHEGSFYPVALLRQFVRALHNTSDFGPSQLLTVPISMRGPSLLLEETLLPTYVWQQHKRLAASRGASPPVIARLWTTGHTVSLGGLARLVEMMHATSFREAHPHLCGLKLPTQAASYHTVTGITEKHLRDLLLAAQAPSLQRRSWIEFNSSFDAPQADAHRRCRAFDDDEASCEDAHVEGERCHFFSLTGTGACKPKNATSHVARLALLAHVHEHSSSDGGGSSSGVGNGSSFNAGPGSTGTAAALRRP